MAAPGPSTKRKYDDAPKIVYSQPAATGSGHEVRTNVFYAISHLQTKEQPLTFREILDYLSLQDKEDSTKRAIEILLRRHPKVDHDPAGANGKGTYAYKPMHNVSSAEELLKLLQNQKTAAGIPVKELKDGWADATEIINTLALEHRVLVTRNKKDDSPKMVWSNDHTLNHDIDNDFKALWSGIKLPDTQAELRDKLVGYGITPTSQVKAPLVNKDQGKKKRAARRGGKTTNTHMLSKMKDYSHLRK
ncbi:hypothetical protein FH972_021203 [Carpinus fangiana]|uniref:TFIIE beta domain-containing protein n=1 Tax=Carpinus fangiana TaxID=176857 RepID=A0A5N6KP17_9ROSI|nr:hypothetical protein FH972_021203 [Carpinus fangiana]